MSYLFYLFIFFFGSAIGSFLNVIICRLETGEGIVKKRSHCPKCGQILGWRELIPIVSFFILRGRCRHCGKGISVQYPLVEIITGILFVVITQYLVILSASEGSLATNAGFFASLRMTSYINLFYYLYVVCSLLVIFVYDLRHYIIPDVVLFPAIGVSFFYRLFEILNLGSISNIEFRNLNFEILLNPLASAFAASAFFLAIILITRGKGMGLGDAKLAFLMGLLLGWPNILAALFIAFFVGAMVGVGLIIQGKKTMKSQIPFGPFLIGGTIIFLLFGQFFWRWQEMIFF